MKRIGFIALGVAALLSLSGCNKKAAVDNSLEELKSRGVFVLGLDDSFPPLGFKNDDGEIVGYDIDLAKEVASRIGVEFKAQPIDWDAKEMELATGKIDCIWNGLTITKERQEALAMSEAYLNNEQILVVRKNSGIKSLADMAGKTIGLQSGSSAQIAVNENKDFENSLKGQIFFKENLTAMSDLEIGGIDAVVMDSVVASYAISQGKDALEIVDETLAKESYGIAFRKEDLKLKKEVEKILHAMSEDGTLEAISIKWFGRNISVIGR